VPTFGNFAGLVVQAGGLLAYSRDAKESYQGVARLLKKILDGADAAELPFEQPTKFHLSVNLKTAKTLGLEIPSTLLATADEVIERSGWATNFPPKDETSSHRRLMWP
jgi:putative ABC transport system substrate-binding protein